MQDRDYHELGDQDLRDRLARHKPADAKELPQPASLPTHDVGVDSDQFDKALAEAGLVERRGVLVPTAVANANITFSQLPDGRMFFTVELPAGGYEKLMMADRQALLDAAVAQIRDQLAKLWSIGA